MALQVNGCILILYIVIIHCSAQAHTSGVTESAKYLDNLGNRESGIFFLYVLFMLITMVSTIRKTHVFYNLGLGNIRINPNL